MGLDYKAAGVDKEAGYKQVQLIKDMVQATFTDEVLTDVGGFSGLFQPNLTDVAEPVLVTGTDGVGTKLKIAQALDKHDTIGIDLVAMCVNDILCQGARPLFFLDYIATGKLDPEKMATIVSGVAEGCKQSSSALIGGETAEMPGLYGENEYDLAGFSVGMVDKKKIITGKDITAGDVAIGLASSGVHSNGFSLVRAVLDKHAIDFKDTVEGIDGPIGEALLEPTKIYAIEIQALLQEVEIKGLAHITGGGLYENLPRVLPEAFGIEIDTTVIPEQKIFQVIQELGGIATEEMYNTFNMGVGMVAFVSEEDTDQTLPLLRAQGTEAFVLGQVSNAVEGVQLK